MMLQVLSAAQDLWQISKQRIRGVTLSCLFLHLAFEWHKAVCFSERRLTVKGGKTLSTLSASIAAAIRAETASVGEIWLWKHQR